MVFKEVLSKSYRLNNAVVTLHAFSAGTGVLNITATEGTCPEMNRCSIWVNTNEMDELADALKGFKQLMKEAQSAAD